MSNELAIKALNQYRKRDILPYLALRYYVENSVGRQNRWITDICTRLTCENSQFGYLRMYHFKDISDGICNHRDIYIPAPSEALAEVALITELSKHEEFTPKPYVYSYRLSSKNDKSGVFKPYFNGFKERHMSISDVCKKTEDGVVLFTDIKKFYPSICSIDALKSWSKTCENANISETYRQLGIRILNNHSQVCKKDGTGKGLLTGPAISHVIANLLLDQIDYDMHEISNGNYWRYVDDVVFVGSHEQVNSWRKELSEKFNDLKLLLHDGDKDFQISCTEWLSGEFDYDNSIGIEWAALIGNIKRFLLANPLKKNDLQICFQKNNIRIPIVDYSNAVKESNYLQKFQDWMRKYKWANKSVRSITIDSLLTQAKKCEIKLTEQLSNLLDGDSTRSSSPFTTKRITPKLRYLSGRLLYLSSTDDLRRFYEVLIKWPELYLIAKTMEAVYSKNFTDILSMGANATHSAAQLVRTENITSVYINEDVKRNPIIDQSLAILEINGIEHNLIADNTDLMLLAKGENTLNLMHSENYFIREFACLHGIGEPRHETILDSIIDRDEDLALDILNQLQKSSHC